jgi:hygromycin-B 4-O-kinase
MNKPTVSSEQAQSFLHKLGINASKVELVGAGAWSQCFGFRQADKHLVIRFGHYLDDFQTDNVAFKYNHSDLPIPEVLELGEAFHGYYAISTRVFGVPLESLNARAWRTVVPSLVSALERMRLADLSDTSGIGGWGSESKAPYTTWRQHLLAVNDDTPQRRTYGWQEKLATFREGYETFEWGYELLGRVTDDAVPRSLVHADLINRNVFVKNDKISGVFDWGCSLYGDHLYDLAWFEFWASWYPELDMTLLRSALEQRWSEIAYAPENKDSRLLACYLHIGLDHLAYNAYREDWATLLATAERMKRLADQQRKN